MDEKKFDDQFRHFNTENLALSDNVQNFDLFLSFLTNKIYGQAGAELGQAPPIRAETG